MELNIRIPDHTAAIFDYLQKGQFISSNSTNEDICNLYDMIDDDFEALSVYFAQIGYTLERGNEYFYFSRIEPRVTLEQKILRAYYWIDVLRNPAFYGGISCRKHFFFNFYSLM